MKHQKDYIIGHFSALGAYLIWGVLPIYWKQLDHIPAQEILAHRIFWGFIFLLLFNIFSNRKRYFHLLKERKKRNSMFLTAGLIAINWMIFIYAVTSEQILAASLGYFINPLVSVLLGMLFLKEKLNPLKTIAVIFALTGVAYLGFNYGELPWISVGLALSFGLYGMFKKIFNLDSINSIMIETMTLSVVCISFLTILGVKGEGHFLTHSFNTDIYLIISGIVTMLPLFLFAEGARKIPLSSVGFLQYFAPTLMFLIGVLKYKEPLTNTYLVSFLFIWAGLAFYSANILRNQVRKGYYKKQ
jgi:chloramphenicol-sensitive protein RarD